MNDCDICRRVTDKINVFFEDENVIASLSREQVTQGKTSVYYKKHATKFTDLSKNDRDSLMDSVVKVARILENFFKPDHMNYELLGNYYPHIHWHLIPRYFNKDKDNFYLKKGLEPCQLGRAIKGKYTIDSKKLNKLTNKIKSSWI